MIIGEFHSCAERSRSMTLKNNKYKQMKTEPKNWTKEELKIYILLLCTKADSVETPEEINLIKSKTNPETFKKIHNEFRGDKKKKSLKKIEAAIAIHHYDEMELMELRKEIRQVYSADKNFAISERYLDQILDNIIY
jgi:hypothetical protein